MAKNIQPKKPPSAFFLWFQFHRGQIQDEIEVERGLKERGLKLKASEVAKAAGEKWRALPLGSQKPWKDAQKTNDLAHAEALRIFKEGGGQAIRKSTKDKKGKRRKKTRKDPNAPKRPPCGGGFGVYLGEKREEIKKSLPVDHKVTDVSKAAGAQYKSLPEMEKRVYEDKFKAAQAEYKTALAEYKAAHPEQKETASPATEASRKRSAGESSTEPQTKLRRKQGKSDQSAEAESKEPFEVSLMQLSGSVVPVGGLFLEDKLEALRIKAAEVYNTKLCAVKLTLRDKVFAPRDSSKTLKSLGIRKGLELMFYRLPLLEVTANMKIVVEEAGSAACNGVYKSMGQGGGEYRCGDWFKQEEGEFELAWWHAHSDWPSGWYLETQGTYIASYFMECDDNKFLPQYNWFPYNAKYHCNPGADPAPIFSVQ